MEASVDFKLVNFIKGESAKQCIRAYTSFINDFPDYDVQVILCGYGQSEYDSALKV